MTPDLQAKLRELAIDTLETIYNEIRVRKAYGEEAAIRRALEVYGNAVCEAALALQEPSPLPLGAEEVATVLQQMEMREYRDDALPPVHSPRLTKSEWREMASWLRDVLVKTSSQLARQAHAMA